MIINTIKIILCKATDTNLLSFFSRPTTAINYDSEIKIVLHHGRNSSSEILFKDISTSCQGILKLDSNYVMYQASDLNITVDQESVRLEILGREFYVHLNSDDVGYDHVDELLSGERKNGINYDKQKVPFSVCGHNSSGNSIVGFNEAITIYGSDYVEKGQNNEQYEQHEQYEQYEQYDEQ